MLDLNDRDDGYFDDCPLCQMMKEEEKQGNVVEIEINLDPQAELRGEKMAEGIGFEDEKSNI